MEGLRDTDGETETEMAASSAASRASRVVVPLLSGSNGVVASAAQKAADILKSGGVIAMPTDTIYGLAALAQNAKAVRKLYSIKGRDDAKPIAICVAEIEDVARWSDVKSKADRAALEPIVRELLPGPVTVVLPRAPKLNPEFNPKATLVGVRVPDHGFIREVCRLCGGESPLALTSANRSAEQSTLAVEEFSGLFARLDAVFDGGRISGETNEARLGSTVVDLSGGGRSFKVIRPGCAMDRTRRILGQHGFSELK